MIIESTDRYWIDIMTLRTEMKFREFTKESMTRYEQVVRHFLEDTGKEVYELKQEDADDYLKSFEKKDYLESTIYQKETYINFFYEHCVGIKRYRRYERSPQKSEFFTPEEFRYILENSTNRERVIYNLLWNGMRAKEVVEIQLKDCFVAENIIKTKTGNIDISYMEDTFRAYIFEDREEFGDSELFIKLGRKVTAEVIKRDFQKLRVRLDIEKDINPEAFRYSNGFILYRQGKFEELMKLLRYEKKQSIILKYGGGRTDFTE